MTTYSSPEVQTVSIDTVTVNNKYTIKCDFVTMGEPGLANMYYEYTITGPGLELIDLGAGSPGYLAHACMNVNGMTVVFGWASGHYDLDRPVKWYDGDKSTRVPVPSITFTLDSPSIYTNENDDLLIDANEAAPIEWVYGTRFDPIESAAMLSAWLQSNDLLN